jgi:hypothetical protein
MGASQNSDLSLPSDAANGESLRSDSEVVQRIPRIGGHIYPGWRVGTAPGPAVWGPKPDQVAIDTFRAVFQKSDWDHHTMDFDNDIARSDRLGNT